MVVNSSYYAKLSFTGTNNRKLLSFKRFCIYLIFFLYVYLIKHLMNIKGYNVDKYNKRVIYTLRNLLGIVGSSLKYLGLRF